MKDTADSNENTIEPTLILERGTASVVTAPRGAMTGGSLPSTDIVRTALEAKGIDAEAIAAIVGFVAYGRSKEIRSNAELGNLLGYDGSTMGRILNGKYEAKLDGVLSKIQAFMSVRLERDKLGAIPFIETKLAKEIWSICEFIRISQTIGYIHGPNQSGKTQALEEYQRRNNHGRTIFVRVPVGGSYPQFVTALSKACGFSKNDTTSERLQRVQDYFRPEMLLIIDEAHQCFVHGVKLKTLEQIRELRDLTGAGVVLCGTDVIADSLGNPKFQGFLGQLSNRGTVRRMIDAKPYREDVLAFCDAYGFGTPQEGTDAHREVFTIANTNGVGKLCKVFEMAQRYAKNRGEAPNWQAFLTTTATLRQWEKGGRK